MEKINLSKVQQSIADVQEKNLEDLMNKDHVVGCGIGKKISNGKITNKDSLMVFVTAKVNTVDLASADLVPAKIGDVQTDIVEVGQIFAQSDPTLRNKVRPAEGGYSVGHYQITAGTIATSVVDREPSPGIPRKYYILSNNHVLANSNNAQIGDAIYQPGTYDGGTSADQIAKLSRFIPINFNGRCNLVDAAIAEGDLKDLDREVYWSGFVNEFGWARVGDIVHKTGRTTGHTTGKVLAINATVNVNFGGGKVAKFCRQIITTNMSAGGDSGSLTINESGQGVGLLFAGSRSITIHNHLPYVMTLLGIKLH